MARRGLQAELARERVELETVPPRPGEAPARRPSTPASASPARLPVARTTNAFGARCSLAGSDVRVIRTDGRGDGGLDRRPGRAAADWDEREAHDRYGLRVRRPRAAAAVARSRPRSRELDGARARRRRTPGCGGADARRGDRVGPLSLPRRRRAHPGARSAAVLQASRPASSPPRACRSPTGSRSRSAPAAPAPSPTPSPTPRPARCCRDWRRLRAVRKARTVLLELERLYNHLHDIAAICAGVGFATGNMAFAALKERALRLNREVGGHRFLFGTVQRSAATRSSSIGVRELQRARGTLRDLHVDAAAAWRELEFAASFQARLDGVGVLTLDDAVRLGAVGPVARAQRDARRRSQRTARASGTERRSQPLASPIPPVTWPPGCGSGRRSSRQPSSMLDDLLADAAGERSRRTERGQARIGVGPGRESAGRDGLCWSRPITAGSRACICAPARTRTGPRSRTPRPASCCPTSR